MDAADMLRCHHTTELPEDTVSAIRVTVSAITLVAAFLVGTQVRIDLDTRPETKEFDQVSWCRSVEEDSTIIGCRYVHGVWVPED